MADTFSDLMHQFRRTHFREPPLDTFTFRQLCAENNLSEGAARRWLRRAIACGEVERVGDISTGGRAGAHEVVYREVQK